MKFTLLIGVQMERKWAVVGGIRRFASGGIESDISLSVGRFYRTKCL